MINPSHAHHRQEPEDQYHSAGGDFLDSQMETSDDVEIGRVADIEATWREDGRLMLSALLTGPQTLAKRVARPLGTLFRLIFHDRFEHAIPMSELAKVGLTLRLRGDAADYPTGQSEQWIASHILRWLPGSGYKKQTARKGKQVLYTRPDDARIIRVEELFGSKIVTHEGKRIGHVFDLQVSRKPTYEVVSLVYGRFALFYRMHVLHPFADMLHLSEEPETIAWSQVATFAHRTVTLKEKNES